MTGFYDQMHIDDPSVLARTIFVDTMKVRATDFDIDATTQEQLYDNGRHAAEPVPRRARPAIPRGTGTATSPRTALRTPPRRAPGADGPAITLVDHTARHAPPAGVLVAIAEALTVQIQRDFAPAWGVEDATVTVNGRGDKIHFFDRRAPHATAYGYHEVDPQGQPYAHVAAEASLHAGNTWVSGTDAISASASHEALEMLGDPWANEWCFDGNAKLCVSARCAIPCRKTSTRSAWAGST